MTVKSKIFAVILCAALIFIAGCKRTTLFDSYVPTESCYDFGNFSDNYDHYWWGTGIYYAAYTINRDKTITAISINVKGDDTAIVYLADGSTGRVLSYSDLSGTGVSEGWNTVNLLNSVAVTAGSSYILGVQVIGYADSAGIRMKESAGDTYFMSNSWGNNPVTIYGGTYKNYSLFIYGNYCQ